jgi:hypothetical protein
MNQPVKNARILDYTYYPQPPTPKDTQTKLEYQLELDMIKKRSKYVEGIHTDETYTTIAHLWLIKQMVKAKEWRFISDRDNSIISAMFRVFSKEVYRGDAHCFICQIDRSKSLKESFTEYHAAKSYLTSWGVNKGYVYEKLSKLAFLYLKDLFNTHEFHDTELVSGVPYKKRGKNPIEHPLPSVDQGTRWVDCLTDLSSYSPEDKANMVLSVNDKSVNAFMQQIRRRLSILERPLVTARGDGKSYIYSNFNPRYAQYAITILRAFYNFCMPYKSFDGVKATPAQRLGFTEKQFDLRDIIYFK